MEIFNWNDGQNCYKSNHFITFKNIHFNKLKPRAAEPVILVNDEGGKTFWREEDYEISVKVMFLILLKKNFDHSFINQSPISIDFFDQWWRLKRADTPIHSREILENVQSSILEQIQLTGKDLPDSFISNLKKS
ncbi:MAG TPA: hypothetical protein VIO64_07030 [Pseudobacteroides sp.]|uniref:hypothetical protein n=1 Tax=Pseudobacteroides sp. TaxID=1968840 RepID=UPI002F91CC25